MGLFTTWIPVLIAVHRHPRQPCRHAAAVCEELRARAGYTHFSSVLVSQSRHPRSWPTIAMLDKLFDRIHGFRPNFFACIAVSAVVSILWLLVTPRWPLACAAAPASSKAFASTQTFAAPGATAPTRSNLPLKAVQSDSFSAITSARGLAAAWRSVLHRNAIDFIRHALGSEAMLKELDASDGRHRIFELFRSTLECDLNDFIRYISSIVIVLMSSYELYDFFYN